MERNMVVLRYAIPTGIPTLTSCQRDPRVLGHQSLVSELRYTSTKGLRGKGIRQDIYGASDTRVTIGYQSLVIRIPRAWWAWV